MFTISSVFQQDPTRYLKDVQANLANPTRSTASTLQGLLFQSPKPQVLSRSVQVWVSHVRIDFHAMLTGLGEWLEFIQQWNSGKKREWLARQVPQVFVDGQSLWWNMEQELHRSPRFPFGLVSFRGDTGLVTGRLFHVFCPC